MKNIVGFLGFYYKFLIIFMQRNVILVVTRFTRTIKGAVVNRELPNFQLISVVLFKTFCNRFTRNLVRI